MILPRIDSFGSGLLIIVSPQPQLIELSSLVSIQYLERSCSGKQKCPMVASFLFGLCYTIVVGQLQGGSVITCRMMTCMFQLSETISHILVGCVYAREVWFNLLRRWNWLRLAAGLSTHLEFTDWWMWSRKQVHGDDRKAFHTLVVLFGCIGKKETTASSKTLTCQLLIWYRG